jgi:hypothetical protein
MDEDLRRQDLAAQRSLEQRLDRDSLKRPECRQRVLFAGMGCLPGQDDLFQTDGGQDKEGN